MQNRFGLKDFLLLVLILLSIVIGVTAMIQDDRRFKQTAALESKVSSLEQTLGRIERTLDRGLTVAAPAANANTGTNPSSTTTAGTTPAAATTASADWARAGVEINAQPVPTYATDPKSNADFQTGGTFTEIFEAQMPKVMPFLAQDVYSRRITDQIFEGLGDYDPQTLSIRGVLAEAWQYDPDGMWLRVKIRDNARFSDGVPVTADDVVFTWKDFILNPQLETERARSISDNVSDVVALSEKVVEFTFKTPLYSNLTVALVTEVTPKHFYSSFKPEQINSATSLLLGSGPYKAANTNPNNQWTPGEPFVLVRNESYWGPARGTLDSLRYIVITDDTSALVSYKNGDADMMRPSSSQFVQTQESDPDWDAKHHSLNWINMRSGYSFIGWQCGPRNGKLTPFHDRRVRLAMTHLLDRWRIIREITEGIGEVATGPNNSASPASNPDVTPWPYDLDTARRLLAEAGWADTDSDGILENAAGEEFDFEFTYSRGSEAVERIANYLKDQCALVGIRCTLRTVDWSIYVDILNKRDFDAITMGWSASAPESDPQQIWHSRSIENQGDNFIQWANADADRLIDAGRAELDEAKRMKIWQDLHRVMHEDQPYTFVREAPWLRFISQEFQNIHAYPKGLEQKEFYAVPTPGV